MRELLREHRVPLVVFITAALCMFLGSRWTPRTPLWLHNGWTFIVYTPLPLLAVYLLDAYKRYRGRTKNHIFQPKKNTHTHTHAKQNNKREPF